MTALFPIATWRCLQDANITGILCNIAGHRYWTIAESALNLKFLLLVTVPELPELMLRPVRDELSDGMWHKAWGSWINLDARVKPGNTGANFAAGMTGGRAFVLDMNEDFERRCNSAQVTVSNLNAREDSFERAALLNLIQRHVRFTGSEWGQRILENFEHFMFFFRVVEPKQQKAADKAVPVALKVVG